MSVVDVELIEESQSRYLTYALSVVSGRALPDVRDGLKPVQRRILYAMFNNLHLTPDRPFRKSAAVVGEVLARYHPHGDTACYDAMVRMAQDFSLRYPLVEGQGNFGSLDGDAPAAYRYTEARLTELALEVIGDIGQDTIVLRDNFDQTVVEPTVLPSRVPNLLMNGAAGIAVGMATSIPPHNLKEIVKGLLMILEDPKLSDRKLLGVIKGPDFPTGCQILSSKKELLEVYSSGRGAIRMQSEYSLEKRGRGKYQIIVTSIPYAVDKSSLVEKIADYIIARKVPQLVDVRDESTDEVRIVMELASGADPKKAMAFLYKNTPLQTNFNVNLTALVPTSNPLTGRPTRLSLREMLQHFIDFRFSVTRKKLEYEKARLEERIHLLEGLLTVIDVLDEAIRIIRKSSGRADAASALRKRFKLSEVQSLFIVDLRLYQLSKTSVEEVEKERKEKADRVSEIQRILKSKKALTKVIADDLGRVSEQYGDVRRSKVISEYEEIEFDHDDYVQHEDVHVIVTADGWTKRIRQTNDPATTRIREGDSLFFTRPCSTQDCIAFFSNQGNVFVTRVMELASTSGFGSPVQKHFRFSDGEQVVSCLVYKDTGDKQRELDLLLCSARGMGVRLPFSNITETKKNGKRLMKLKDGDRMASASLLDGRLVIAVSRQGYALCVKPSELPVLSGAGRGVSLLKLPEDDELVVASSVNRKSKLKLMVSGKGIKELEVSKMSVSSRARRGLKLVKRGLPVVGLVEVVG